MTNLDGNRVMWLRLSVGLADRINRNDIRAMDGGLPSTSTRNWDSKWRTEHHCHLSVKLRSQHGILEYWILDSEASGILDIGFRKPPDIGY